MSGRWATSARRSQLPSNWKALVLETARRAGGQCEWISESGRCTSLGTECDHRTNPSNHHDLQWLCAPHHTEKTQAEARAAAKAQRERLTHPSHRESHPGLR